MSKETENAGSNLVFFLLGAAIGASVALLYAPQEGAATRHLIGEKAGQARDKATELTGNLSTTAKEKWQTASDKAKELLHRGVATTHEEIDAAAEEAHALVEELG